MFIDFLTVMLIDISAGLAIMGLAACRLHDESLKKLAPGLLVSGFVALATGLQVCFSWPLPGSYNIAFGDLAVLFGALFLGAGLAGLFDWDLLSLGVYSMFAGVASIVIGLRVLDLKMTTEPLVAGLGFILTGFVALVILPVYLLRKNRVVRILAAIALFGSAGIWAVTGYLSYWSHLQNFAKWLPAAMAQAVK